MEMRNCFDLWDMGLGIEAFLNWSAATLEPRIPGLILATNQWKVSNDFV